MSSSNALFVSAENSTISRDESQENLEKLLLKLSQLTEKHESLQNEYSVSARTIMQLREQLNEERKINANLTREKYELTELLTKEKQLTAELQQSTNALSHELEEFTKNLLEEAGGMVAKEAKQRHRIQTQQTALQSELEMANDMIEVLQCQVKQLKELAEQKNSDFAEDPSSFLILQQKEFILQDYHQLVPTPNELMDFLEGHHEDGASFLARSKVTMKQTHDATLYRHFTDFLHNEDQSGSFLKRLYYSEIEPTISGSFKSLAFPVKKIADALRYAKCTIETVCDASEIFQQLTSERTPDAATSFDDSANFISSSATHTILNLFSSLGLSSAIENPLETSVFSDDSSSNASTLTAASKKPLPRTPESCNLELRDRLRLRCGLCGQSFSVEGEKFVYRMRFAADERPWMYIDCFCREKLVSVGNLYAFLRSIKNGSFNSYPEYMIWLLFQSHRREMFYARTGTRAFFLANDSLRFRKFFNDAINSQK